jgi:hypothetical protein
MLGWKREQLNKTKIIYFLLTFIYQFLVIQNPTVVTVARCQLLPSGAKPGKIEITKRIPHPGEVNR